MSSVVERDSGFYTFLWAIKNFSFCPEKPNYCIESPEFKMGTCGETEWSMKLYPNGYNSSVDDIEYSLQLLSATPMVATSTISIVAADGFNYFSFEKINKKFPDAAMEKFVKLRRLLGRKNFYMPKDTLTIRCDIQKCPTDKPLINRCDMRSEFGIHHLFVPWNITHFSKLSLGTPLKLPLSFNFKNAPAFEIHLYLMGINVDSSHVQIDIKKLSSYCVPKYLYIHYQTCSENHSSSVTIHCEASVLNSKNIPALRVEGKRFFDSQEGSVKNGPLTSCPTEVIWRLPETAKRNYLLANKNLYLPDDVLSLRFKLTVSTGEISSLPADVHAVYPDTGCVKSSTMKNDFKLLYQEQKFCDITLKTATKTYKAHKAVLACRSPVFKAMFEHDMIENISGIVKVTDDPKILEQILFFMYADQLQNGLDPKTVIQLYRAADKYQIHSLKEFCYPILKSLVTIENVVDVLSLAYKYHDDNLKSIGKAFICKNPSETVDSNVWERLMEGKWSQPEVMFVNDISERESPLRSNALPDKGNTVTKKKLRRSKY